MVCSFHTAAGSLCGHLPPPAAADMSFLRDVHPEDTDALLGFVYDPLDGANAALDDLPDDAKSEQHCAKKPRACAAADSWYGLADLQRNGGGNHQVPALPELLTDFLLPLPLLPPPPQPLAFVHGADGKKAGGNACQQAVQSAVARERRRRISEKTAQLSRLIPGGHKLNTAEMLEEAGRHVKLLQAHMHTENGKIPIKAQEQMRSLLVCGSVQERLATEGKCLVPRKLVEAVANDNALKSNARVNRDLRRFMASLEK